MPRKCSDRNKKLSRREMRDLEVKITFIEGVVRRDPKFIEALQILGDHYTQRGKYEHSLKVDQQLSQLEPRNPLVFYNLACSYSLTRQLRRSADALGQAIDRGYRNYRFLLKDPDLVNLRRHAVFKRVQAKMRTLAVIFG